MTAEPMTPEALRRLMSAPDAAPDHLSEYRARLRLAYVQGAQGDVVLDAGERGRETGRLLGEILSRGDAGQAVRLAFILAALRGPQETER